MTMAPLFFLNITLECHNVYNQPLFKIKMPNYHIVSDRYFHCIGLNLYIKSIISRYTLKK